MNKLIFPLLIVSFVFLLTSCTRQLGTVTGPPFSTQQTEIVSDNTLECGQIALDAVDELLDGTATGGDVFNRIVQATHDLNVDGTEVMAAMVSLRLSLYREGLLSSFNKDDVSHNYQGILSARNELAAALGEDERIYFSTGKSYPTDLSGSAVGKLSGTHSIFNPLKDNTAYSSNLYIISGYIVDIEEHDDFGSVLTVQIDEDTQIAIMAGVEYFAEAGVQSCISYYAAQGKTVEATANTYMMELMFYPMPEVGEMAVFYASYEGYLKGSAIPGFLYGGRDYLATALDWCITVEEIQ